MNKGEYMCTFYSGHTVTEKGKDWGKVLVITGVHHEKDREDGRVSKYGENLIAWECNKSFSFSEGIHISHSCGKNLKQDEKDALLEITLNWCKKQSKSYLYNLVVKDNRDDSRFRYCCEVADQKELWSAITKDYYKYMYCRYVKDRKELGFTIENDYYKYMYCRFVKDRKELWGTITHTKIKEAYSLMVQARPEMK